MYINQSTQPTDPIHATGKQQTTHRPVSVIKRALIALRHAVDLRHAAVVAGRLPGLLVARWSLVCLIQAYAIALLQLQRSTAIIRQCAAASQFQRTHLIGIDLIDICAGAARRPHHRIARASRCCLIVTV